MAKTSIQTSFNDIKRIHPGMGMKFCGHPQNGIMDVSDEMLNYVISILKKNPVKIPQASTQEWFELLDILSLHWVLPLIYRQIGKNINIALLPYFVVERMRATFQWSRARCFQMEIQMQEILTAFNDNGIRVIVLKGPAFGRTVYPDPALRPSSDLDLLVSRDEVISARNILKSLDYDCICELFEIYRDFYWSEDFTTRKNSKNRLSICCHWTLHYFYGKKDQISFEDLFQNSVNLKEGGVCFKALHPVDALIHASLHLICNHNQDLRLIWIYDIALLASSLKLPKDWETLKEKSSIWGALLAVQASLTLAQIVTDKPLPDEIKDFSTWPKPAKAEVKSMSITFNWTNSFTRFKLYMAVFAKSKYKTCFLFRLIFPAKDLLKLSNDYQDKPFFFFSYLNRFKRLIKGVFLK